jgi:hypothetical protein
LLLLCGCIHFCRLELRSTGDEPLALKTRAIQSQVGSVLTDAGFTQLTGRDYTEKLKLDPGLVAEWHCLASKGFWAGLTVEMYARGNVISVVISSGKYQSGKGAQSACNVLERLIAEKFPDVDIRVTSQTYPSPFAP